MCEAQRSERWDHTSYVCCVVYNASAAKGRKAKPIDFHPMHQKKRRKQAPKLSREQTTARLHALFRTGHGRYQGIPGG